MIIAQVNAPEWLRRPRGALRAVDPVRHHESYHRLSNWGMACRLCKRQYADEYELRYHEKIDHMESA
jgi:hypothetical protein